MENTNVGTCSKLTTRRMHSSHYRAPPPLPQPSVEVLLNAPSEAAKQAAAKRVLNPCRKQAAYLNTASPYSRNHRAAPRLVHKRQPMDTPSSGVQSPRSRMLSSARQQRPVPPLPGTTTALKERHNDGAASTPDVSRSPHRPAPSPAFTSSSSDWRSRSQRAYRQPPTLPDEVGRPAARCGQQVHRPPPAFPTNSRIDHRPATESDAICDILRDIPPQKVPVAGAHRPPPALCPPPTPVTSTTKSSTPVPVLADRPTPNHPRNQPVSSIEKISQEGIQNKPVLKMSIPPERSPGHPLHLLEAKSPRKSLTATRTTGNTKKNPPRSYRTPQPSDLEPPLAFETPEELLVEMLDTRPSHCSQSLHELRPMSAWQADMKSEQLAVVGLLGVLALKHTLARRYASYAGPIQQDCSYGHHADPLGAIQE